MAGALSLIGNKDGPPVIPLNFLADFCGGPLFATIGILAALVAREKTGKGQYLDINYVDGIIALLKDYSAPYFQYGAIPKRGETMLSGGVPYINVYETKDGGFISIACFEPWLWENLCRAIGKEEFIPFHQEPEHLLRSPEGKEWDKIRSYLKQVFLTKSRDEWFHFLSQKDIPVGKVYSLDEVFSDPQVLHRNMVIEVDHPTVGKVKQIGIPIKLSDTPGKVRSPSPTLGEHHEEILVDLGYDKQTVDELRRKGIVG
jgi:crotonobetainyl-CoA:carnitine CoA-transferase CaiB-like acyl-CoA transferase